MALNLKGMRRYWEVDVECVFMMMQILKFIMDNSDRCSTLISESSLRWLLLGSCRLLVLTMLNFWNSYGMFSIPHFLLVCPTIEDLFAHILNPTLYCLYSRAVCSYLKINVHFLAFFRKIHAHTCKKKNMKGWSKIDTSTYYFAIPSS